MEGWIYKIVNTITGDTYVGQTTAIRERFKRHKNELLKLRHCNSILQNHYNKYGSENFRYEILEEYKFPCNYSKDYVKEFLASREIYFIEKLNPTINIVKDITNSRLGKKATLEDRQKLSKSHLGKKLSEEHKEAISKGNKGKPKNSKGKNRDPVDVQKSIEKRAESAKEKGYWFTETHIQNIQKAKSWYKPTQETKDKIRQTKLGTVATEESKKKLSESLRKVYFKLFDVFLGDTHIATYGSQQVAAQELKIPNSNSISLCLNGKQKTSKGYSFKYKNE